MKTKEENLSIPKWMSESDNEIIIKNKGGGTGFLRRTLKGITKVLENDVLAERNASNSGLLQNIDPRVKFLSILFLMLFCSSTGSIAKIVALSFVALLLAKLSGLDIWTFIKRVWLIIPVIVMVASLPAATNLLIAGKPVLYFYKGLDLGVLPDELYLSLEGITAVIRMALRIGCSISFAYNLIMTTRWTQLVKSLYILKVPKLIISVLDMTYRFIFVLLRVASDIFEARFLRTVGKIRASENRKFIAKSIAFLFLKSNYMSEEIYEAMLSRGYTGTPVTMRDFKLSAQDLVWILNLLVISVIIMVI
jgi:cobalt/nickel transport system permease protein